MADADAPVVVYEHVLDELLAELRTNIMTRRDGYQMPAEDETLQAVSRRVSWLSATAKDLGGAEQLTLLGSADDVAARNAVRARAKASLLDMAAWLVHDRLRADHPFARTLREIEEERERELRAEAERARKRREQPELFEGDVDEEANRT